MLLNWDGAGGSARDSGWGYFQLLEGGHVINEELPPPRVLSFNFHTELARELADLAPEIIADGKLDIQKLAELLGEDTAAAHERFGLVWPGKRDAQRIAQTPTTATLLPDREAAKDWDTTQNVFIEGDNLEVLKVLQKHYYGKVKMIYIDPPYNTGQDFVYKDNFRHGVTSYLEWTQQTNESGKVSSNAETAGRYHSNWLNMMYPRLKLARNLLKDDGVIAISIDDDEMPRLRMLAEEIFGEQLFYAQIVWQKKYSPANDAKRFSDMHDYVMLFARSEKFVRNLFPRTEENDKPYVHDDGDGRGRYRTDNLSVRTYSVSGDYPVTNPNTGEEYSPPTGRCWTFSKESMKVFMADNRIYWGADGTGRPQLKRYLSEVQRGTVPTTWWAHDFAGHNDEGRKEIRALFGTTAVFDTPKPTKLVRRLLQVCTSPDAGDIVLDFFAGSGTTAHAVIAQNAEDGGIRHCISVQLPEPLAGNALNTDFDVETIADVTRERIRLAGDKILGDESEKLSDRVEKLDIGFRAYKLADTNFRKWRANGNTTEEELAELFDLSRDSANNAASPEDLFIETVLKLGLSLTESYEQTDISGLNVFSIDAGLVIGYFDEDVKPTLEQLRGLVDATKARLIILEDAFHGDDELKTNVAQACKTRGIDLSIA